MPLEGTAADPDAGSAAEWVHEHPVVEDNGVFNLISSRKPDDLPAFCKELVSQIEQV